jgi:Xaa-Pro aminopeptidase
MIALQGHPSRMTNRDRTIMVGNHTQAAARSTPTTSGAGNYDLVSKGGEPERSRDMIWMDCGCAVDGYYSDLSRAAVLGGPTKAQEEVQSEIHRITWMGVERCALASVAEIRRAATRR